jgi:hypothetical protein
MSKHASKPVRMAALVAAGALKEDWAIDMIALCDFGPA